MPVHDIIPHINFDKIKSQVDLKIQSRMSNEKNDSY